MTTIDFNPPIIPPADSDTPAVDLGMPLRALTPSQLAAEQSSGAPPFALAVSFSGLEHDGLGRYGDPVHPDGDLAAMREIWLSLRPKGILLLSVPTCHRDTLFYPWHRVYGPSRLERMLRGFTLLARVWDGKVVHGGLEAAYTQPALFASRGSAGSCWWQHQHILVLERAAWHATHQSS